MTSAPDFLAYNVNITNYSSFRTPAHAKYFFDLRDKDDLPKLREIAQFADTNNLPMVFIGGGTNLLFAFDVFGGIIIHNGLRGIQYGEAAVTVACGELITPLSLAISKSRENSLYGKWIWLPGTVGGAIAGNAGCFGFEMSHAFVSARAMDTRSGDIFTLSHADMEFSYRHSTMKHHPEWFLIDAVLRSDLISDDATDPRTFRSSKQPSGFTCGSFFRNPPWDSAGRLIDAAGLKWTRIGGAHISELHANFFMNDGAGSYRDILALRDLAKSKIKELHGVELQEEVRIIENRTSLDGRLSHTP